MDHTQRSAQQSLGMDAASLPPRAAALCIVCTAMCISLAAIVHVFFDYADVRPPISSEEDPWMAFVLQSVATTSLAGLLFELGMRLCVNIAGTEDAYGPEGILCNRLNLNKRMIIIFAVLTAGYHAMAFDVQWVHEGWIAKHYGGVQIVYSVRYIEWVLCAPLLISVLCDIPEVPTVPQCKGLWRSAVLTGAYCLISWQGLVVKSVFAAWLCIGWAFFCYIVASWEQLLFAWHLKDQGPAGRLKASLLLYMVGTFGVYGVVYLLPMSGWMSPTLENKLYCILDMSFKIGTSTLIVSWYDVSTNMRSRSEAEIEAEDMQGLIDNASVPIFAVDGSGRVSQWNRKAQELLGYSEDEAKGMVLLDMVSSHYRAEVADVMLQTLAGERTSCVQIEMRTRSMRMGEGCGTPATILLSACPCNGRARGVTFLGVDLTQVEAYKAAEVRKAHFMGVVSHELRSPLHGIVGLAQHLIEEESDGQKAEQLLVVKTCSERLLDLVVTLMEMASLAQKGPNGSKKTLALHLEEVDMQTVVEEALTLVRNAEDRSRRPLLRAGVKLVNRVQDIPLIEADKSRCMQVFFNILANACESTQRGEITVSSSADPNGRWVDIQVKDTGRGIPQHSLERIFQPFEQEDTSDDGHYGSVGLGLSIAQEIAQLHGWRINVQSEVGVGTMFTVRLLNKVARATMGASSPTSANQRFISSKTGEAEVDPKPVKRVDPKPTQPPKRPKRERPLVLSVDDGAVNQAVIEDVLGKACDVHSVTGSGAAIEYLETCGPGLPDVAVIDAVILEVSGIDVRQHIRKQMGLSAEELPVLMVTASCSKAWWDEDLAIGGGTHFSPVADERRLRACWKPAGQAKRDA